MPVFRRSERVSRIAPILCLFNTDSDQVALEAGNSASIIFKHHLKLTKPEVAEKWFSWKLSAAKPLPTKMRGLGFENAAHVIQFRILLKAAPIAQSISIIAVLGSGMTWR